MGDWKVIPEEGAISADDQGRASALDAVREAQICFLVTGYAAPHAGGFHIQVGARFFGVPGAADAEDDQAILREFLGRAGQLVARAVSDLDGLG